MASGRTLQFYRIFLSKGSKECYETLHRTGNRATGAEERAFKEQGYDIVGYGKELTHLSD